MVYIFIAAALSLFSCSTVGADSTVRSTDESIYAAYTSREIIRLPELNNPLDFENMDLKLLQAAIRALTNRERAAHGLAELDHDHSLEQAAEEHSRAMRDRGFFSHTSPVPGRRTVGDRVTAAGFRGTGFGENIATSFGIQYEAGRQVFVPSQNGGYFSYEFQGAPIPPHSYLSAAEVVVQQWMDSPGHRANILRPEFRYIGIGAAYETDP
ncbi:MAG: CAP domain-containing protein, partial [Spirochaetaceae bacterium]